MSSASIHVEIPDGLDPDEAREAAIEAALEKGVPGLCHQCSGYSRNYSREDPGEWQVDAEWTFKEVPSEHTVQIQA